jgi:cell division protein ZapE
MSVSGLYKARARERGFQADPAQEAVAQRLDRLCAELARGRGWFGRRKPVRGVYLWGAVGRGKSMLMDLFVQSCRCKGVQRVHFHEFMLERHAFLRQARERGREAGEDLIADAAKEAAQGLRVLCLDELQITDITDAMLVGRLFEQIFARGLTVVITSNRPPSDLYKNGINRQLFEPFIALLQQQLDVVELAAARDYRLERLVEAPVWITPLGPAADAALREAWRRLTFGAEARATVVEVQGRRWRIPCAAAGCAKASFDTLCRQPLGAADYLELAGRFHTLLLEGVPVLEPAEREAAARFRTLIDALYEAKTKLIATAAAEPAALYPEGEQAFEFERTVSRLMEMRSREYLSAPRQEPER